MIEGIEKIPAQYDRLKELISRLEGNFIEIGAGFGFITRLMLDRAKELNTKVYVIDPFKYIEGTDKSYFEPYKKMEFMSNVNDLMEYMILIEKPSQDKSVWKEIRRVKDIAMIYVDGLQTKDAVLYDLKMSDKLNPQIIVVDDIDRLTGSSEIPLAIKEFKTKRKFHDTGHKEGYFI